MDLLERHNLEFRESQHFGQQWLWPKEDTVTWKYLNKSGPRSLPDRIANLSSNKNLILQAGGNCGLYPKQYSKMFKTVITFEPDPRNFFCLSYNVTESNVFKFQACLGNNSDFLNVNYNDKWNETNRGAMRVDGFGNIPQITIDGLNLNPNVIHLDIEGYEGYALLGAVNTIKRCSPLIVLETNEACEKYNWTQSKIDQMLFDLNYKILEDWGHDKVYVKSEK